MTPRRVVTALVALALGLAALAAVSGCQSLEEFKWWDYRDEPYLADAGRGGEEQALRNATSLNHEQRQIALRYLAYRAGEYRRRGDIANADRLEEILVRRYAADRSGEVRATIVSICAPAAGRGSARMADFLRARLASGEYPGYAALSLAYLAPPNAVQDIEPLTRHPAVEVRYQAAVALTVLRDPRGFDAVNRTWQSMRAPVWPAQVDGVPLPEARELLGRRALRAFHRPLYE